MSAINARQIARMRSHVTNYLLPGTAVIQSLTTGHDSGGAATETWTAVTGGTVACRLDPVGQSTSAEVELNFGKETLNVLQQLTVPHDAPLNEHNRVVINSDETWEIIQLSVDHTPAWNVSKRAIVNRVT